MGARRSGREAALQMLFAMEASGHDADHVIAAFWRNFDGDPEGRAYADTLVRGISESLTEIDPLVRGASTNWRLERMSRVDRNQLRLGAF